MSIKKIVCTSILALTMSSISSLAFAKLTIVNDSDSDSTAIINDGKCSSSLPFEKGVTKAHSINELNDIIINVACRGNTTNCKADVYMTNHCNANGEGKVATVIFDTKKGIQNITNYPSSGFDISGSGFSITAKNIK